MPIEADSQRICAELFRLLQRTRVEKGLSKYAVAARSGLSQQTIGYVEKGTISPSLDTILRIAMAL